LTSSWSVFMPDEVSAKYSSSFPSSEASAIVTWTPRISSGSGTGSGLGGAVGVAVPPALSPASACVVAGWSRPLRKLAPSATTAAERAKTVRTAMRLLARL
jgi:hypothetical protein